MHSLLVRIMLIGCLIGTPTLVEAKILISEFSIGGGSGHTDDDFIELLNTDMKPVSLEHWKLRKRIKNGTESSIRELGKTDCIAPLGSFLWVNSKAKSEYKKLANTTTGTTLTPDNSIALVDDSGTLQDTITFGSNHTNPFFGISPILSNPEHDLAHVRNLSSLLWTENQTPTPTPASMDACDITPESPLPPKSPSPESTRVRFNEIFPNPATSQDSGEYIELWNAGTNPVDLSRWKITDASRSGRYIFPADTTLQAQHFLVITDHDFSFSLNNDQETLSLFDTNETLIDTFTYTKTVVDASLNLTDTGWRMSKTLTPGLPNVLSNTLPVTQMHVPNIGYRNTYLHFQADGKDTDGDALKYVWDFGDHHKSYQKNTRHRYQETGDFTITLTTKDGSEETNQSFPITIHDFSPPKLRITTFSPNPAGVDTTPQAEWIEIKNFSKKEVSLLGYSIATGRKKLINHPIRTHFVIPKKSVRRLTREDALFTLPNQKGKIELRAPDGTPIHSLKYSFPTSLVEGTLLKKEKGERLALVVPPGAIPRDKHQSSLQLDNTPLPDSASLTASDIAPPISIQKPNLYQVSLENPIFLRLAVQGTSFVLPPKKYLSLRTQKNIEATDHVLTSGEHYALRFIRTVALAGNQLLASTFSF